MLVSCRFASCRVGEILGTITDRDIAIRFVANEMPPTVAAGELATPETIF
jgi:hypothetical protein